MTAVITFIIMNYLVYGFLLVDFNAFRWRVSMRYSYVISIIVSLLIHKFFL